MVDAVNSASRQRRNRLVQVISIYMTKILIVDPIFRGSRLFYTWMAHQAFCANGVRPRILTRKEYLSDDFPAYFDNSRDIDAVIDLPKGLWYGKISDEAIFHLLDEVARYVGDEPAHVHFSGLDEMFPTLLDALVERFSESRNPTTFSMVQYDARYHLSSGAGFLKMRSRIRAALQSLPNMYVLLLDDRLEGGLCDEFARQAIIIPDPAPISEEEIEKIRAESASSSLFENVGNEIRVVALGRQSERKGLPDIIRAARELDQSSNIRLYVSGSLEPGQEKLRTPLQELTPHSIVWRDSYVAEAEIRRTYRDSHYVLLPYARSFEGSSGVFSYAAAFGKPLIASDHGCIGYRIKKHGLGYVYPSGNASALAGILKELPSPESREYGEMQDRVAQYESAHNMGEFSRRLADIVTEAQKDVKEPSLLVRKNSKAGGASGANSGTMLQTSLERMSTAPQSLDYKQIMLFDTSVSSKNIGDQIIMESMRPLLRYVFPKSIFVNVPTHEYTGTEALKLIDKSEYSFVCGTNLLASHVNDYKQWKLQGTDAFMLSDLTLMGVGWWQYQDPPNAYTQFLYRRILSDATLHSVRDGYTKKQLALAGITNVINTCCPTTWWLTPKHLETIPKEKRDTVVFTFTDYARNPQADSAIIEELTKRYSEVYCWLQGANDYEYAQSIASTSVKYIAPTLEAYAEFLAATDCDYVGTRLHGGIRALQAGRRALILAVDNRASEISFDIGLPVVARDNLEDLRRHLDNGWDLDIHVPYADINAWIRQFGHSDDFRIESIIDGLIHGFPLDEKSIERTQSPLRATISGEHRGDAYMHYRVQFIDYNSGEELAFLMYRTESVLGITIRPGKDGSPSLDTFGGITFSTDNYGDYFQIQFRQNESGLATSSDVSNNEGRLLKVFDHYLGAAQKDAPMRISVRPEIVDRMAAKAMLHEVAEEFCRRR